MQNKIDLIEDLQELTISLNLENHIKFYEFSMMETTIENGVVLKNEINKTIHCTILKSGYHVFDVQIEAFDIELKNRTYSISEKEFISRIAEINDNIIVQINSLGENPKVINHKEILQRLEEKISRLAKSNVGPNVEASFQYLRDFYRNKTRIILDTKNYRQHGLLLHSFYGKYTPETIRKRIVRYINFMENTLAHVEEQAVVKNIKIKTRKVEISVSGELVEPLYQSMFVKSMQQKQIDFNENDKISLDKYEGNFIIDIDSGVVRNATIAIEFSFGSNYKKTIDYQLNELKDADNDR
jgi:hypothetical protein